MTVIPDLPHTDYLKMPALSVSGMKMLLPPSCPAAFDYWRKNRRPSKPAFDFGHVAHGLVLGDGPEIVVIDADDWRTKAAREERDEAYEAGAVPILTADHAKAAALAAAVRANRLADALLSHGKAEQSLFWTDKDTDVPMRARADWLPEKRPGRRFIASDLKTAASADPRTFAKSAANFGYAQQAAQYIDGIKACGLDDDPGFVFIVVEKEPPHLVSVIELDTDALAIGRDLNAKATRIFKACTESGHWPGFGEDVTRISLPTWFVRQAENDLEEEESAA